MPDQGGLNNKSIGPDNESEEGKTILVLIYTGKSKRRSKNDVDGRDFKCKYCNKFIAYLWSMLCIIN